MDAKNWKRWGLVCHIRKRERGKKKRGKITAAAKRKFGRRENLGNASRGCWGGGVSGPERGKKSTARGS